MRRINVSKSIHLLPRKTRYCKACMLMKRILLPFYASAHYIVNIFETDMLSTSITTKSSFINNETKPDKHNMCEYS